MTLKSFVPSACALTVATALAFFAGPATAAMFKCSGAGGTTFQQVPCDNSKDAAAPAYLPAGAPKDSHDAAPAVPVASAAARAGGDQSASPAEVAVDPQEINRGIVGSYPVRGMTISQLQSALGTPERVNSGEYPGGYSEQRIYTKPRVRYYVYTDGAKVRSIQSSQLVEAEPQAASRYCPSLFEIKNEEVSANSITLTDQQRKEKLDHIKAMRECRT